MRVLVHVSGNSLAVSGVDFDGMCRLPVGLLAELEEMASYTQVNYDRGAHTWNKRTGKRQHAVSSTLCRLYDVDEMGRLCCGAGYLDSALAIIKKHGLQAKMVTDAVNHPRPNRYEQDWESVCDSFEFRYRQEECLISMVARERGICLAPPAFGKTTLFRAFCRLFPKANIHIIAPGLSTQRRIVRELLRYFSCVGEVSGAKTLWDRITVVSADSILRVQGTDRHSYENADIVLADELHELVTEERIRGLSCYQDARMYGFDGSFERFDGRCALAEQLFGKVAFEISYEEAEKNKMVVPIVVDWINASHLENPLPYDVAVSAGDDSRCYRDDQRDRACVWNHEARNRLIADYALKLPDDVQTLILVNSIDHALELKKLLPDYVMVYDKINDKSNPRRYEMAVERGILDPVLDPIVSKRLRLKYQDQFEDRKILKAIATDVWIKSVNFESLEVVIRADARVSYASSIQGPGRVCRVSDGKSCGKVVDVYDGFHRIYEERSRKRWKHYAKQGWTNVLPK